jgi:hypothetical protein
MREDYCLYKDFFAFFRPSIYDGTFFQAYSGNSVIEGGTGKAVIQERTVTITYLGVLFK